MRATLLPADAPLGAKLVDLGVRAARPSAWATLTLVVAAVAIATLAPRPYVDRVIVEIGTRFLGEPLEHPVRTAIRLNALCRAAADVRDPEARVEVRPRRNEKTNAVTRVMDVQVEAATATAARSILGLGLSRLLIEHRAATRYELQVHQEQLAEFEAALARLERAAAAATGDEREAFEARLYETRRALEGVTEVVERGSLETRILSRASEPEPKGSRLPVLLVGAVLLGLLLGVCWAAVGAELERVARGPRDSSDPFLRELFEITSRYRRLILAGALLGAAFGLGVGYQLPGRTKVRAVVELAKIPPEVVRDDMDAIAKGLESHVAGQVLADLLPEGTELETLVIRDQPPQATKQAMIELTGVGPTLESARGAVDAAIARVLSVETAEADAERARFERLAQGLSVGLERLAALPETVENHATRIKTVIDRTDLRRRLSPTRTRPPSVVAEPRTLEPARATRMSGFGIAFLLAGLLGGYLTSFFLAGLGYLRGIRQQGTE